MVAGYVGDAGHRLAGKVSGDAHQEEIGNHGAGDYDRNGEDLARQQIWIDTVREADNECEPDQVHDQRNSEADAVDRFAGEVSVLCIDDVFILDARIGICGFYDIFGHLVEVRQKPHGVPAMVTLSGIYNPVLVPHHLVHTAEELHIKGGADNADRQEHDCMSNFHWHGCIPPILYVWSRTSTPRWRQTARTATLYSRPGRTSDCRDLHLPHRKRSRSR